MAVKRPGIVTILAIFAFIGVLITGYKLLIYLGILPLSLGTLALFGSSSFGAIGTAIEFIVLLAVLYGLWTLKPWGWLLTLIVGLYGLFLAIFEWLSQSSFYLVSAGVLINVLILASILSPRARNAFAAAEQQRKGTAQ